MKIKTFFLNIKNWLSGLSFRTGLIVLGLCIICYIISFAQALLPISLAWKGALWIIFFGLAKTFQYTSLLIFGKEGIRRLKSFFKNRRTGKILDQ